MNICFVPSDKVGLNRSTLTSKDTISTYRTKKRIHSFFVIFKFLDSIDVDCLVYDSKKFVKNVLHDTS